MTDFEVMQRVFDLATKGGHNVAPNPLVGCVITKNGKIIGEGWHKKYGDHHAEVNAIRDCQKKFGKSAAKKLLHQSTFFVNLEPCSIEKNTPPCTEKLIEFKAKKLVCSIKDPNPLINGRGIKKLKQAGIDVQLGLMKGEARRLNKIFIANHLYSRPFITIKVAQTLDSKIGLRGAGQVRITNNKSIKDVHKLRREHDSIMIGSGTLNEDNPMLSTRFSLSKKISQPIKVIIGNNVNVKSKMRLFEDFSKVIFASTKEIVIPKDLPKDVINFKNAKQNIFENLFSYLLDLNCRSILVEGGSKLFRSFLSKGYYDELIIYTAPKIIGHEGIHGIDVDVDSFKSKMLTLDAIENFGNDLKVTYINKKPNGI